ncbi:hypothetical protein ABT095_28250 [Kitasatospora sp. NPDC002227]|uniref:hypothetical protein n=1 Tax=Kitasatospora sp. NPDC002227 TaxID=3154773 RepID=UPI003328E120
MNQQLRHGETVFGSFDLALDRLLPLYFDPERFAGDVLLMPFRWLWDGIRSVLTAAIPPWVRELLGLDRRYRQYGLYPWSRFYRTVRRPLHGGSWHGGRGSTAGRLWLAVRTSPARLSPDHRDFTLVLTDQRLLAFSRVRLSDPRPVFELPRGSYRLRPDTPGSWWNRRIDLAFPDGSWIALSAASWFFGYTDQEEAKVKALTDLLR